MINNMALMSEAVFFEPELDVVNEYERLKTKMENALGNTDPRMPRNYIKQALLDTLNNFEMHQENIFPE